MKALTLTADFEPCSTYQLNERERTTHRIQAGSQVWKNPRIAVGQVADPTLKDNEAIRMMASGKLDMRPMVSARMALDDALSAFKRLENRQDAKIILLPN